MTKVAKYNTYKGISTGITFGTPIATMLAVGKLFVERPATAISGGAVFALLLSALLLKDKLAENFKMPSALVIAVIVFVFCVLVENIIRPMKIISLVTIIACGVDELTFKGLYKRIETGFPKKAAEYKHYGFYAVKQPKIDELNAKEQKENEN